MNSLNPIPPAVASVYNHILKLNPYVPSLKSEELKETCAHIVSTKWDNTPPPSTKFYFSATSTIPFFYLNPDLFCIYVHLSSFYENEKNGSSIYRAILWKIDCYARHVVVCSNKIVNKSMQKRFDTKSYFCEYLNKHPSNFFPQTIAILECPPFYYFIQEGFDNNLYGLNFTRLSQTQKTDIFFKIIRCIEKLASLNILHRDVKPENILYRQENQETKVVINDFDLAITLDEISSVSSLSGTLTSIPPECFRDFFIETPIKEAHLNPNARYIWELGLILNELFTLDITLPWDLNKDNDTPLAKVAISLPLSVKIEDRNALLQAFAIGPSSETDTKLTRLACQMLQSDPSKRPALNTISQLFLDAVSEAPQPSELLPTLKV